MHDDSPDLSFEGAFAELQRVIEELRSDSLTLDRSLALYERGTALAERCNLLLTAAELRVTQSAPGLSASKGLRESFLENDW
jgi:exodeoxyribonuclease VII small subunit